MIAFVRRPSPHSSSRLLRSMSPASVSLSRGRMCKNGWTDRRPVWSGDSWESKKRSIRWGRHLPRQGRGASMRRLQTYFGYLLPFMFVSGCAVAVITLPHKTYVRTLCCAFATSCTKNRTPTYTWPQLCGVLTNFRNYFTETFVVNFIYSCLQWKNLKSAKFSQCCRYRSGPFLITAYTNCLWRRFTSLVILKAELWWNDKKTNSSRYLVVFFSQESVEQSTSSFAGFWTNTS